MDPSDLLALPAGGWLLARLRQIGDPAFQADLLKVRKGSVAGLTAIRRITRIYDFLGGSIVPGVYPVPILQHYQRSWVTTDPAVLAAWKALLHPVDEPPEAAEPGRIYIRGPVLERTPWTPAHGSDKRLHYGIQLPGPRGAPPGVSDDETPPPEASRDPMTWIGAHGYRITLPGAEPWTVTTDPYRMRGASLWTDGPPNGVPPIQDVYMLWPRSGTPQGEALVRLASRALGMLTPVEEVQAKEAARKRAKVEKGMGTCGVCFDVHARHLKSDVIVQHGYRMGGNTYGRGHLGMFKASGDCFGVGYRPWEVSPSATVAFAAHLRVLAQRRREDAAAWERAADVQPGEEAASGLAPHYLRMDFIVHPARYGRGPTRERTARYTLPPAGQPRPADEVREVVTPGHPDWRMLALKDRDANVAEAEGLDKDALWYETTAAGWPTLPTGGGRLG